MEMQCFKYSGLYIFEIVKHIYNYSNLTRQETCYMKKMSHTFAQIVKSAYCIYNKPIVLISILNRMDDKTIELKSILNRIYYKINRIHINIEQKIV